MSRISQLKCGGDETIATDGTHMQETQTEVDKSPSLVRNTDTWQEGSGSASMRRRSSTGDRPDLYRVPSIVRAGIAMAQAHTQDFERRKSPSDEDELDPALDDGDGEDEEENSDDKEQQK